MHDPSNSAVINQPIIKACRKVKRGTTVTNRKLRLDRPSEDALMAAVELLSSSGRDVCTVAMVARRALFTYGTYLANRQGDSRFLEGERKAVRVNSFLPKVIVKRAEPREEIQ